MRQIVLDTETTGLDPQEGHRIIEIGCVELMDRRPTDRRFHTYINPEREIDQGAVQVHGIDNQFLADKPLFSDIVDSFLDFINSSEVIIHNAAFDVGFLNAELSRLEADYGRLEDHCSILDTLIMARRKHPGQRNSLDALCKRYQIDNSHRNLHGALLDAQILASVYLVLTGGQISLYQEEEHETSSYLSDISANLTQVDRPKMKRFTCPPEELKAHEKRLRAIDEASGGNCLWLQKSP